MNNWGFLRKKSPYVFGKKFSTSVYFSCDLLNFINFSYVLDWCSIGIIFCYFVMYVWEIGQY